LPVLGGVELQQESIVDRKHSERLVDDNQITFSQSVSLDAQSNFLNQDPINSQQETELGNLMQLHESTSGSIPERSSNDRESRRLII